MFLSVRKLHERSYTDQITRFKHNILGDGMISYIPSVTDRESVHCQILSDESTNAVVSHVDVSTVDVDDLISHSPLCCVCLRIFTPVT